MLIQSKNNLYFYLLLAFLLAGFIFFSHPFLKYPYDVFAHLIAIDEFYHGAETTTTSIQHTRLIWHDIWANIFHLLQLPSADMFLRAKVIYIVQTLFSFFAIYFFSKVIFRNLLKDIDPLSVKLLSLWSVIIWLSIFATFSLHYHLVWTLWYGVNYQMTLPLFWYITALTIVLLHEQSSTFKKLFYTVQISLISLFILKVHAMEFMYYLMYVSLLLLLYIDSSYKILKKYYYILVPLVIISIYLFTYVLEESSKILSYFSPEKLPLLYESILTQGEHVTQHLNRANYAMNELIYLSLALCIGIIIFLFFDKNKYINKRFYIFILLSSFFILIPLYVFSSGLFALIARPDVIHRIYYSSSIFIILPLTAYVFVRSIKLPLYLVHLFIFLILLGTALYSKYSHNTSHNYYKNILSIKNSFKSHPYDFNLDDKEIEKIGQILEESSKTNKLDDKMYYYARSDIAFVLKYMYQKQVFWRGRRVNPDYRKHYQEDIAPKGHKKVLFKTPKSFPKYIPYY